MTIIDGIVLANDLSSALAALIMRIRAAHEANSEVVDISQLGNRLHLANEGLRALLDAVPAPDEKVGGTD
jgi:hypothetical protein